MSLWIDKNQQQTHKDNFNMTNSVGYVKQNDYLV